MNGYTLYDIARERQRDLLHEKEHDRLANEAAEMKKPAEKEQLSVIEILVSYLPKKTASRTR